MKHEFNTFFFVHSHFTLIFKYILYYQDIRTFVRIITVKMSDDEMEKFEITDYDLDNEFNMNRPQRRLTKNQAIYGNV